MAYPIPNYVPAAIVERIYRKRLDVNPHYSLSHLAEEARVARTTVVHFFKEAQYESLFQFKKFCTGIGATMDDVSHMLRLSEAHRKVALERLIYDRYPSKLAMARACGISHNYIHDLTNGGGGKKILELYCPIAAALGANLEQLATMVGDSK